MISRVKYIILGLSVFIAEISNTYSQSKIDSLQSLLIIPTADSTRVYLLFDLAQEEYKEFSYHEAKLYAEQSLEIAIRLDYKEIEARNYCLLGNIYKQRNECEKAIPYYLRANIIYDELSDTKQKAISYQSIAECYSLLGAYSKSAEYYINSFNLFNSSGQKIKVSETLEKGADAYFKDNKYLQAEKYYFLLIDSLISDYKTYDLLRIYIQVIEVEKKVNNYNKALEFNNIIYAIYSDLADTTSMALVLNNIGYTNLKLEKYPEALDAFKKSIKFGKKSGFTTEDFANLYSNISICYQNLKDNDRAINNIRIALDSLYRTKNYYEIARLENITANLFYKTNDMYYADMYSKNSIESAKKSGDKFLLSVCYYTYSRILRDGNDYILALEYYEKYLNLRDSLNFVQKLAEQEKTRKVNDLEKSEKEAKLQIADEQVKDLALKQLRTEAEKREKELELLRSEKELEQSEKDRLQQSLQIAKQQHEADLRQKELKQLEQDKEIQDLLLKQKDAEEKEREKTIKLLESEKELQKLELEKQAEEKKRAQWMVGLASIIVVLVLVSWSITRRKNAILARQKIEIEEKNADLEQKNEEIMTQSERIIQQKDLIEKKNEEITDSIHYASRIQNALLPSVEMISKHIDEYFILFKPKDIVSGDFYWASEKNNKLVITAVDCTGHGVPGAFMSMLGMSFLNEIVGKEKVTEAHVILNRLREEIINSLKQSGRDDEAKDGMDMALCVIDKEKMKLYYSGANNPIYFIRNGVLEKIKSDRMPIGIHYKADVSFTKTEIDLLKGDIIYIFTDGFADQFGGDDGRKLKYQPFQQLLFGMHKEPMEKQKEMLYNAFENWRGDYEQIDDVLVIGIKI
jgi:serine phosphatase RsbU (regulator of sigma subunit)/tetratricopeptide (TPR) repeat protein